MELKIVNDPKVGQNVEWKLENKCHGVKNVEFKFTEMRKLFSENNFFRNTCSLIPHVDISEINISVA